MNNRVITHVITNKNPVMKKPNNKLDKFKVSFPKSFIDSVNAGVSWQCNHHNITYATSVMQMTDSVMYSTSGDSVYRLGLIDVDKPFCDVTYYEVIKVKEVIDNVSGKTVYECYTKYKTPMGLNVTIIPVNYFDPKTINNHLQFIIDRKLLDKPVELVKGSKFVVNYKTNADTMLVVAPQNVKVKLNKENSKLLVAIDEDTTIENFKVELKFSYKDESLTKVIRFKVVEAKEEVTEDESDDWYGNIIDDLDLIPQTINNEEVFILDYNTNAESVSVELDSSDESYITDDNLINIEVVEEDAEIKVWISDDVAVGSKFKINVIFSHKGNTLIKSIEFVVVEAGIDGVEDESEEDVDTTEDEVDNDDSTDEPTTDDTSDEDVDDGSDDEVVDDATTPSDDSEN